MTAVYHNPLFSFAEVYFDHLGEQVIFIKIALLPFVYLISLASLHLVERPCRKSKFLGARGVLIGASTGIIFATGLGVFIHIQNGFLSQITRYYEQRGMPLLVNVAVERQLIDLARLEALEPSRPFECADCKKVLLIGDSLSDDSYLALSLHGTGAEYRRVYFDDSCMRGVQNIVSLETTLICNNRAISFGNLLHDADSIILAAKWMENTYLDGLALAKVLQRDTDAKVVVIGAAMFTNITSFSLKAWRAGYEREQFPEVFYRYQRWDRLRSTEKLEELVQNESGITWVSRQEFFCDNGELICQLFDEEGAPLIWDNAHLTTHAYAKYARFLEQKAKIVP